jgi:hypothetical protein
MKKIVHWPIFFISISLVSVLALGVSYFFGFSYWLAFAVILAAMLINGIVATVEDELPGGFNNPKPEGVKHEQQ